MWLLGILACGGGEPAADSDGTAGAPSATIAPATERVCSGFLNLEVVATDLWGRDLDATLAFDRTPPLLDDASAAPGSAWLPLAEAPLTLTVVAEAPDHHGATLQITHDGSGALAYEVLGEDARWTTSTETREGPEGPCPTETLYVGLAHAWFASTAAAPTDNAVELLVNGEVFWGDVASRLAGAQRRVTWSSWWWDSTFELVRPVGLPVGPTEEREGATAMGLLEGLDGVDRKVLINRFWGENTDFSTLINTDDVLRGYATTAGDGFDVVLQGNSTEVPLFGAYEGAVADFDYGARLRDNPRYADRDIPRAPLPPPEDYAIEAASWHQKAIVMDGEVAWVSGFNTKADDWDTDLHAVYDLQRMAFDATEEDRQAVADRARLPDYVPRRDYGIRVEGPAVRDVEATFLERWERAVADDALYADKATDFVLDEAPASPPGSVPVQVVRTMPAPWNEQSILETHVRAVHQATGLVVIEDQYLRSPLLQQALVARMLQEPSLHVVAVTIDVAAWDPGAKYTYLFDSALRELFPARYRLYHLLATDLVVDDVGARFDVVPIYTHSKLRIIGDRYVSLGSCNVNNRGYLFEGELNVSVLDADFARAARDRVLGDWAGPEAAVTLPDDPAAVLAHLDGVAASNAEHLAWWEANVARLSPAEAEAEWRTRAPSGWLYPLEPTADYLFDVGPDLF